MSGKPPSPGSTPLALLLRRHLEWSQLEHSPKHHRLKRGRLWRFMRESGAQRVGDLTYETVDSHLQRRAASGAGPRTLNLVRADLIALLGWLEARELVSEHCVRSVKRVRKRRENCRPRAALDEHQIRALIAVGEARGRACCYYAALCAGLRRGELLALEWRDVSMVDRVITVRPEVGKANRTDEIPIHPDLDAALRRHLDAHPPSGPRDLLFRGQGPEPGQVPAIRTYRHDLLEAGIAHRAVVLNPDGSATRKRGPRGVQTDEPQTRIVACDHRGRAIDFHALRTTCGTRLARAGVDAEHCRRIMRHSDIKTTQRHYQDLTRADRARAMNRVPSIHPQQLRLWAMADRPGGARVSGRERHRNA